MTTTTLPSPSPADLRAWLEGRQPAILADWQQRLQHLGGNYLKSLTPPEELDAEMRALLIHLCAMLDPEEPPFEVIDSHPLVTHLMASAEVRAARGFTPAESLQYLQSCKQALLAIYEAQPPSQVACLRDRLDPLMDRCVQVLFATYVKTREEVIRRQTESLREVSAPVITLWDSMLLLPLVGIVDSVRAQQISEDLLQAISRSEAEVTLIDVTGVPVMDSSVASHLLRTVTAAEMLGTRVILTGIAPGTAQTMVKLGIDMSAVPTRASLKAGLALALAVTGRSITSQPAKKV